MVYGLAALELDGRALVGIGKLEALLALRQPRDRRRQRAALVFAHLDRDIIFRIVIRHAGDRVLRRGFRKGIGILFPHFGRDPSHQRRRDHLRYERLLHPRKRYAG